MSPLDPKARFTDGDAFYAALIDALDAAGPDATAFLGRLALILANQVGDQAVLLAAIEEASREHSSPE